MADELTVWLREQIADDERVARAGEPDHEGLWRKLGNDGFEDHILRWQPTRVLAECDAKRRLVELHGPVDVHDDSSCRECSDSGWAGSVDGHSPVDLPCPTLRLLCLPYSDRPGYREEWRP